MALHASNELRAGQVWGPCSLDAQWTPASGPNAEARTGWHDLRHLWASASPCAVSVAGGHGDAQAAITAVVGIITICLCTSGVDEAARAFLPLSPSYPRPGSAPGAHLVPNTRKAGRG